MAGRDKGKDKVEIYAREGMARETNKLWHITAKIKAKSHGKIRKITKHEMKQNPRANNIAGNKQIRKNEVNKQSNQTAKSDNQTTNQINTQPTRK